MFITIETLKKFSSLQSGLLLALGEQYNVQDVLLSKLPWQGEIEVNGTNWIFAKHGRGVRFTNEIMGVIDSHIINPSAPDAFDSWGIVQYLESVGCDELNERDVNASLAVLEGEGKIRRYNELNFYRLV